MKEAEGIERGRTRVCVVNLGSTEKAGAEIPVAADPPDRYHISLEKLFRTILCATLIKYLVSIINFRGVFSI